MIETHISTGRDVTARLTSAILLYEANTGHSYLEHRKIVEGPDGPEYGAGKPLDMATFARLVRGRRTRVLTATHPRLLATGEEEAIWWSPASPRTPFFSQAGDLAEHSARAVPMPAFVFHARKQQLRIRAIACRGRPKPTTPLFYAPLRNVYKTGWVCMGSMPVPDGHPASRIEAWETAFWDTTFTTAHVERLCLHPNGYAAMLTDLRASPRFPSPWLVPTRERLGSWLTS